VPARSRLPTCHSPNSFPKLSLLMLPSLTVAEEVLPSLGRLFAPPALTIILQPKLLEVRSCRCMPASHRIIPDCQRLLAAHQDWPLTSILPGSLSNPVPIVLLQRLFSHCVFATALCSEILRTLFAAEMNARSYSIITAKVRRDLLESQKKYTEKKYCKYNDFNKCFERQAYTEKTIREEIL